MNNLPDEISNKIYRYVHQMTFYQVMDELTFYLVNTRFKISLFMLKNMYYYHNNIKSHCINYKNIYESAYVILKSIKTKEYK